MKKMGGDPEKGLPMHEDCLTVIGHIRARIREFGEILQDQNQLTRNGLTTVYNQLCDAVIIFLQQWSANRDHEVSSITKIQYAKAELRTPINGTTLTVQRIYLCDMKHCFQNSI
jgi:hypothetical protein